MKTWIIAAALGIGLSAAGVSGVFAQAGSTGGTIGKEDKSLSGGEPERRAPREAPARMPREASPSSPAVISLREHNATWGEFSVTLRRTSGNAYEGTWNHGLVSQMTVQIGPSSMSINRHDIAGGNLCRGHYSGTRSGSRASGDAVISCNIGGTTSTWDASW
jgi:hypothetical protein